jgi:predicted nucleic acid-binding protein
MAVATVHNRPITITGTIGIILTAVRSGVIEMTTAEMVYQEMLAAGFRAPVRRLADWLGSN